MTEHDSMLHEIQALRDKVTALTQERDEARAWVDRIQNERCVMTCVYCGHAYPPGTPTSGAQALTDHIKVCKKHPMRAAEQRIATLEKALTHYGQHDGDCPVRDWMPLNLNGRAEIPPACTCGLDAALAGGKE